MGRAHNRAARTARAARAGTAAGAPRAAVAARAAIAAGAALIAALSLLAFAAWPAGAQAPSGQPWTGTPRDGLYRPVMPDPKLDPPTSVRPVLVAYGQGVQRYVCNPKAQAAGTFEWTLKEPVAKLNDDQNREIGTHFAGPSWQLADGSKVVKKKVLGTTPALQFDAVPWLLVEVESSGQGKLTGVQYVQRVDTVGGVAPATGCDAAHPGALQDVEYRAVYVFYAPRNPS
jgi:Protein of unknown function (DUF3455)